VLLLGAVPAIAQQRLMMSAAAALVSPAGDPAAQVQQRIEAAELLSRAYDAGGRRNPHPLEEAARRHFDHDRSQKRRCLEAGPLARRNRKILGVAGSG
jgi:hypothetical protein